MSIHHDYGGIRVLIQLPEIGDHIIPVIGDGIQLQFQFFGFFLFSLFFKGGDLLLEFFPFLRS